MKPEGPSNMSRSRFMKLPVSLYAFIYLYHSIDMAHISCRF